MPWQIIWSVAAHHSEAVDPDLITWLKDRLDHLLGLGPWTVVAGLSIIIMLIPASIIGLYLMQQRRQSAAKRALKERRDC